MSDIASDARSIAKDFPYLEDESKEKAKEYAEMAAKAIEEHCEDPELEEICDVLDLNHKNVDSNKNIRSKEIALAAWSNIGAGTFEQAVSETHFDEQEFVVIHDNFKELTEIGNS